MIDVSFEVVAVSEAMIKLQADDWELNIWAPIADFVRLQEIGLTDWKTRRTLQVGTTAGAQVFWTVDDDQALILVGADDEAWDFALSVSTATVREIAHLAVRHS